MSSKLFDMELGFKKLRILKICRIDIVDFLDISKRL